MPRESSVNHGNVTAVTEPSSENHGNGTDEGVKSDDASVRHETPSEPPKPALSLDQLTTSGEKQPPKTAAEIPEYLYAPGTKRYEAARIIIFEGIEDNKLIAERSGVTERMVRNVRSEIRRVAKQMADVREAGEKSVTQMRDAGDVTSVTQIDPGTPLLV